MNWKLKSQQNLLETESRTVVARCWGMGKREIAIQWILHNNVHIVNTIVWNI